MDFENNKIKTIVSLLDELKDSLSEKDKNLEVLKKEKDYFSNLVSLNKFEIENLESEKSSLRKQYNTLVEEDYKYKNELQDTKLKLLEYEKSSKELETILNQKYTKKIDELQDKLNRNEIIVKELTLQNEEVDGKNKILERQVEDLEKNRLTTSEYMENYVKKDSYNAINEKCKNLEEKIKSKDIMVEELYQEISYYGNKKFGLSFEESISHIKMRFKQLEHENQTLKIENEVTNQHLTNTTNNFMENEQKNLSQEELKLKENLGL